jgi:hypothetical protein
MKFLGLFAKSAIGSSAVTFLFSAVLFFLAVGVVPVLPLLVQAGVTGVIFGVIFSLVHLKREPTFLSSFGTGIGYGVLNTVIGLLVGTAVGLSLGTLIGVAVMGLLLGGGAYLGTRFGGASK